jgi:hypothetical protein
MGRRRWPLPRDNRISNSAAAKLTTIWENLYVNFDIAAAKKYLAPDLRVISDSINFPAVAPLKNATVCIILPLNIALYATSFHFHPTHVNLILPTESCLYR